MNTVDEYIDQGNSACPYAKGSDRIVVSVGRVPVYSRKRLLEVLRPFAPDRTPAQALMVTGPEIPDFDSTREWARAVFLELYVCFGILDGISEKEIDAHVKEEVRPYLKDEKNPKRPVLGFRRKPLFSICMSPLYPPMHPRYAPEPVVVVTWYEDVAAVMGQPAANRIREAMLREHGFVYDADELMLPLPEPR